MGPLHGRQSLTNFWCWWIVDIYHAFRVEVAGMTSSPVRIEPVSMSGFA